MSNHPLERCPDCGQPIPSRDARTCEQCGHELTDSRITNADVTPYAEAYERNESCFFRMLRWVVFASSERIKHLGLMRSSAASRRFTWFAILWFSLAPALYANSRVGWHFAGSAAGDAAHASLHPIGDGWIQISSNPTAATGGATPGRGLWWNPAQCLIASPALFIVGILLAWLCVGILRWTATRTHSREFRDEGRMSAAISYATAFFALCVIGGGLISLRPFWYMLNANSSAMPSTDGIEILAATVTGAPLVAWWIWLIRLGAGAPAIVRNRMTVVMLLLPPACLTGMAAAIYWSLEWFERSLVPMMHLQF